MARPEAPITGTGPVADLARALRRLRDQAGPPDYRALARKAGFSASTLADAAAGRACPSLDVARAFAGACGASSGELAAVEVLWDTASKAHKTARARAARARRRTREVRGNADSSPRLSLREPRLPAGQPRPDPDGTAAQFVAKLRMLRAWGGQKSYKGLQYETGLSSHEYILRMPRSTFYDALSPNRTTLPSLSVTELIVAGCGGPVDEWTLAWRTIKVREVSTGQEEADSAAS
jgi:hypothetical protein